jgi:hypothetical protein
MSKITHWLRKYFIPHDKNDHMPHVLRHRSFLFFLGLIVLIQLSFVTQIFIVFDKTGFLASVLPGVLTSLTNEKRIENNVPPLIHNELLAKAATMKAEDMAKNEYFAHTSPDGKTPWYWLVQVGYKFFSAGENLAVNFFESEDVAKAWMNSPTHRANIIKEDFTEIGIGVANGMYKGKNTVFVVQYFGKPLQVTSTPKEEGDTTKTITPSVPKANPNPAKIALKEVPLQTEVLGEEETIVNTVLQEPKTTQSVSNLKLFIQKILTSPRTYMTYMYEILVSVLIISLLLAIFIKIRIQHKALIGRGAALVAITLALLFLNQELSKIEVGIPTDGTPASIILAD